MGGLMKIHLTEKQWARSKKRLPQSVIIAKAKAAKKFKRPNKAIKGAWKP